jgi:hypothetical protein
METEVTTVTCGDMELLHSYPGDFYAFAEGLTFTQPARSGARWFYYL